MTDLASLIERIEQAEGPSVELNHEIAAAVGWRAVPNPTAAGGLVGKWWTPDQRMSELPPFTHSLDAAMTLVPEGALWTLEPDTAWVRWIDHDHPAGVNEAQAGYNGREGKATALALCAAALKARMTP
jgi:hypothetical protein